MRTGYSAIALGAMILVSSAAAAGMSQDRIPEPQREARTKSTSATLTGCVAQGVAAGTYVLTKITKAQSGASPVCDPNGFLERPCGIARHWQRDLHSRSLRKCALMTS